MKPRRFQCFEANTDDRATALCRDLIRKVSDDVMQKIRDNINLVPTDDDKEDPKYIINSMLFSVSTMVMDMALGGLIISQSKGKIQPEDVPMDAFANIMLNQMSTIGKVLLAAHNRERKEKAEEKNR